MEWMAAGLAALAVFTVAACQGQARDAMQPRQMTPPRPPHTGLILDSAVTAYTPWSITEEADHLPRNILPAYVGSGLLGAGLDASGMQDLDCDLARDKRYTGVDFEHKDDLYLFHEAMIADHLGPRNLMPLARLVLGLRVDGEDLAEPDRLAGAVTAWRRLHNLRAATVETSYDLRQGVGVALETFVPQESEELLFRITVRSLDGRPHRVVMTPRMELTLRSRNSGGAIYDRIGPLSARYCWGGREATCLPAGPRKAREEYRVGLSAAWSGPGRLLATDGALGVTSDFVVGPGSRTLDLALGAAAGNVVRPGPVRYAARLAAHKRGWDRYWQQCGETWGDDHLRELVAHQSLALFRIGTTYRRGAPLEFHLFHPENWYGGTFWDLTFVMDGLLRWNVLEPARRSVEWLQRVAAPEGRPFHWMTHYDGGSAMPPGSVDTGLMVNAAHATAAIRLYEATGDEALLRDRVYPIVRKVAAWSAASFFKQEGNHWIGGGAGLDANTAMEPNETFTTLWFAAVLRRAALYAERLGVDPVERANWSAIAAGIRPEVGRDGYHQSRSVARPFGWVSLLLYPTEAAPLVDLGRFRVNRPAQAFEYDYHTYQPWVYFWQALSDMRVRGDVAANADARIGEGLKALYGPAYLAEILPAGISMEGLPPYQTAHGSYLAACAEQMVAGDTWSDALDLFVNLPPRLRDRNVGFRGLRSPRGCVVSGEWSPSLVCVTIIAPRATHVRLRLPIAAGTVDVRTGRRVVKGLECRNGLVGLEVPAGRTRAVWRKAR